MNTDWGIGMLSRLLLLFTLVMVRPLWAQDDDFDFSSLEEPKIIASDPVPPQAEPTKPGQVTEPAEPASIDLAIPYVGTVKLFPYKEQGVSGLRTQLPATGNKLELGPLSIGDGWLRLIGGGLGYDAQAQLFGQPVRVGFKDVKLSELKEKQRLPLTLFFDAGKEPTLELIPGAQAKFTAATFTLEKNKPLEMRAQTKIIGVPVDFVFITSSDGKKTDYTAEVTPRPLVDLIPQVKDTSLEKAQLIKLSLSTENFRNPDPAKRLKVTLVGQADISGVPDMPASEQTKTTKLLGEYDKSLDAEGKVKGFYAELIIGDLTIPSVGTIKQAKIIIDRRSGKRSDQLQGTVKLSIPKVGDVDFTVASAITKQGVEFSAFADTTLFGQKVRVRARKDPKTGKLLFDGTAQLDIFGLKLNGTAFIKEDVTIIIAEAPKGFKLSDVGIKGLDDLALANAQFVKSTKDYTGNFDTPDGRQQEMTFKEGISFIAQTKFTGSLAPIGKFTGVSEGTTFTLSGTMQENPPGATLSAHIPTEISLPGGVKINRFELEVASGGQLPAPSVALLAHITIPAGKDTLDFTARVEIGAKRQVLAGTMKGIWSQPFGIPGIDIGNVAVQVDLQTPTPSVTGSLCIGGELRLGDNSCTQAKRKAGEDLCKGGLGGCAAIDLPKAVVAELDHLTLRDLVKVSEGLIKAGTGKSVSLKADVFPEIGYKEVKIYIVPLETKIGEFTFARGFNMQGKFELLGAKAEMGVSLLLQDYGLKALIFVEPIKIPGILEFKGKGNNPRAEGRLDLTLMKQRLSVNGELELFGALKGAGELEISRSGLNFDVLARIRDMDLLSAQVTGKSSGSLTSPQFKLRVAFKQNLIKEVKEKAVEGLQVAQKAVSEGLSSAQREIDKVNNAVKSTQDAMAGARRDLQKAQDALKAITDSKKKVTDAIDSARDAVKSIKERRDERKRRFDKLPDFPC